MEIEKKKKTLSDIHNQLDDDIEILRDKIISKSILDRDKNVISSKKCEMIEKLKLIENDYKEFAGIINNNDFLLNLRYISEFSDQLSYVLKNIKYKHLMKISTNNNKIKDLRLKIQKNELIIFNEINPWAIEMLDKFKNFGGHTNFQCQICHESFGVIPCRFKLPCCYNKKCDYITCSECVRKYIGLVKTKPDETFIEENNRLQKPLKCLICRQERKILKKTKNTCYYYDTHLINCLDSFFRRTLIPQAKKKYGFEPKLHKCKKCLKSFYFLKDLMEHIFTDCPEAYEQCVICKKRHKKIIFHTCDLN